MSTARPAHFVGIPIGPWGHFRPLLHTSLNLLCVHPNLNLTLLVSPSAHPRVTNELALPSLRHLSIPSGSEPAVVNRLQVIEVLDPENPSYQRFKADPSAVERQSDLMAEEGAMFRKMLPDYIGCLFRGKTNIFPDGGENRFAGIDPGFIMYDTINTTVPETATRVCSDLGKKTCYLFGFGPYNAGAIYRMVARAEVGGPFALTRERALKAISEGEDELKAWGDYGWVGVGKMYPLPGYPDKYDYEWYPNAGSTDFPNAMWKMLSEVQEACWHPAVTGIIAPVTPELEPETQKAVEAELGKKCLLLGIQFPETLWSDSSLSIDSPLKPADQQIIAYLDDKLATLGPRSVFFASFGSHFTPTLRPELTRYLLDSLRESGTPFIFANASPNSNLDEKYIQEVNASGDGLIMGFVPQMRILEHEATGCFITHCGSNSSAEAIMTEQPMVCFPYSADQGEFASLWTDIHHVGLTLYQAFTFKNPHELDMSRLYDGTQIIGTEEAIKSEMRCTWDRMKGDECREMRQRMKALKETCKLSWRIGQAHKEMLGMSRYFQVSP